MAKKLRDRYSYDEYLQLIKAIADFVINNNASTRETAKYFTANGIKISNATVSNLLNGAIFKTEFSVEYEKVQEILRNKTTLNVFNDVDTLVRMQKATELSLRGYTLPQIAVELNSTEDIIYRDLTSRLTYLGFDDLSLLVASELWEHRVQNLKR